MLEIQHSCPTCPSGSRCGRDTRNGPLGAPSGTAATAASAYSSSPAPELNASGQGHPYTGRAQAGWKDWEAIVASAQPQRSEEEKGSE